MRADQYLEQLCSDTWTVRTGRNIDGSLRICIYCWDWGKMRLHER